MEMSGLRKRQRSAQCWSDIWTILTTFEWKLLGAYYFSNGAGLNMRRAACEVSVLKRLFPGQSSVRIGSRRDDLRAPRQHFRVAAGVDGIMVVLNCASRELYESLA